MKKILFADDDETILFTFEVSIEELNIDYQLETALNGEECLERLKQEPLPDVILMDLMMPQMDGWEAIDLIRKNEAWKKIPIIIVSAKLEDIKEKAKAYRDVDYMEKPFEVQDLFEKIDALFLDKQ